MCFPLTHVCKNCLTPVRAEVVCRGLCYISIVQTPYVVDEFCPLHIANAGTADEDILDESVMSPTDGEHANPDWLYLDRSYAEQVYEFPIVEPPAADVDTPYSQDVSQFEVNVNDDEWSPEVVAAMEAAIRALLEEMNEHNLESQAEEIEDVVYDFDGTDLFPTEPMDIEE
ncbi:hypothetical protein F4680DRAFT_442396 [Xylaria scruposa]|nr:hypothetical protein F4680DRAFT_442396 [Xylaria scruposa]